MQIEQQLLEELEKDTKLDFKRSTDKNLFNGICPQCRERRLAIRKSQPFQIFCNRKDECGYTESTLKRYSFLWENLAEKYPATKGDPNATAKAYMSMVRHFPLTETEHFYSQGLIKLDNGTAAETVRFKIDGEDYWERLISNDHIALNTKGGNKGIKANFLKPYGDKGWQPPGQLINEKDDVYIVEGIFHAIAYHLVGKKAIAALSSSNLPRDIIKANEGRLITWCLAYDAGPAGEEANLKFQKELNELKEAVKIVLPHSAGVDWDDLYRDNKLTDEYITECIWRGRVLSARSPQQKAFALFCWKSFAHDVITFKNGTYSVEVARGELSDALQKEAATDTISWSQHSEIFKRFVNIRLIADGEFKSLHVERDKFTEETKYVFSVTDKISKREHIISLTAANLQDRKVFSLAVMNKLTWLEFHGNAMDFLALKDKWKHRNEVDTIPFIGFDETSRSYIFPNVGYQDGKCYKKNKHGFIQFPKHSAKTTLTGIDFLHAEKFDSSILHDFFTIFHLNGMAALGWWTATLFTRQIKEAHASFPFLELTGEKEAGKSTLIRFLWKMFGRKHEGIDMLVNSASFEGRILSQLSNLPFVMMESDRETDLTKGGRPAKSIDWDNYKKIYDLDGMIMGRAVKTNDNQVNESLFRAALAVTQNASIQGSEAIISRINHYHCTTAHKRIENRELADRLKTMPIEDLAGYMHLVLTHEKEYLAAFFASFTKHRAVLTKTTSISQRILDNHAQNMAAVEALQVIFPSMPKAMLEQTLKHIAERAQEREYRLKADHPIVQQFWSAYHHINDQTMHIEDNNGNRDVVNEKLNHSLDKNVIAINLNDFQEHCRLRGQEILPIGDLKKLLPTSRRYQFIEDKKVRSRIKKSSVQCFTFQKPAGT